MKCKYVQQCDSIDLNKYEKIDVAGECPREVTYRGKEYQYVRHYEKQFTAHHRFFLGVKTFLKTILFFGVWSSFQKTRDDWKAVWEGKRVGILYKEAAVENAVGDKFEDLDPFSVEPDNKSAFDESDVFQEDLVENGVPLEDPVVNNVSSEVPFEIENGPPPKGIKDGKKEKEATRQLKDGDSAGDLQDTKLLAEKNAEASSESKEYYKEANQELSEQNEKERNKKDAFRDYVISQQHVRREQFERKLQEENKEFDNAIEKLENGDSAGYLQDMERMAKKNCELALFELKDYYKETNPERSAYYERKCNGLPPLSYSTSSRRFQNKRSNREARANQKRLEELLAIRETLNHKPEVEESTKPGEEI